MTDRTCEVCADCFANNIRRIAECVDRLSEEQIWWRPNAATNSVGNMLLHLKGNLSQWILASLGGVAYERRRSAEFAADASASKAQLLDALRSVVERCQSIIRDLSAEELRKPLRIQGYDVDGYHAVLHAMEHMSYHTGQIVHVTKELLGPAGGIDFYPQHRDE
jgi:uncharacterized damage-inducible protein DinB